MSLALVVGLDTVTAFEIAVAVDAGVAAVCPLFDGSMNPAVSVAVILFPASMS
jgi:glycerol uptake facilitator-like aquaporin